jgi:hypothetical protein
VVSDVDLVYRHGDGRSAGGYSVVWCPGDSHGECSRGKVARQHRVDRVVRRRQRYWARLQVAGITWLVDAEVYCPGEPVLA